MFSTQSWDLFRAIRSIRIIRSIFFPSACVFVLDRITKAYAHNLPPGKVVSILPNIDFGYFLNPSLFFFPAWRFIPYLALAVLIALAIFLAVRTKIRQLTPDTWPLIPILLGGASNVFDRFYYNGVIDIIHITGLATINLADILIFLGLIALVLQNRHNNSAITN